METKTTTQLFDEWQLWIPETDKKGFTITERRKKNWFIAVKAIIPQPPHSQFDSFNQAKVLGKFKPTRFIRGTTFIRGTSDQINMVVAMTLKRLKVDFVEIIRTQRNITRYH